jgi:transposase
MERGECENCIKLQMRVEELEKRLLQYENAHTPPSQQRKYPKKEKSNNKIGAPKGHPGTTRETPTPNRFKELKLKKCPDCGKRLGRPRSIHKRIIEDIPEPQPLIITQFTIPHYFCNCCNKQVIPRDSELPDEGLFGFNLQAEIALMKYEDRLPHRKIAGTLNRRYILQLTPATILDITRRVADKLQGNYDEIKQQVKESMQVNADETGIKVKGKQFWTWVFVTLTAALFLIRPNRGQKTVKEALGKDYNGILTCDGWTSYPTCVERIQRCWAHLLREAKWYAEKYEGTARDVYNELCGIFKRIKKITVNTIRGVRTRTYNWCMKEMKYIIGRCNAYTELRSFATKLENGLEHWFTCVLHPQIEPTNNKAERALTEIVVQRKISSLWNEKGVRIKETIISVLATWRLRGLNTYSMLRQTLSS